MSGAVGSYVVLNSDGWIVTAGHLIKHLSDMGAEILGVSKFQSDLEAIKADTSIDERERKKRINKLQKPSKQQTERGGQIWAGQHGTVLVDAKAYFPVDLGIGRLQPFNPAMVTSYPVFKDPTKGFDTGRSLCRMGFPLHHVVPKWDATQQMFDLPQDTFPVPVFPIEGIFTRTIAFAQNPTEPASPFPQRWVETSSPGLKGQSGGPIVDEDGTIWAIQCQTLSYDLGFKTSTNTPQYLNVGVGVHPETLFAVFDAEGIKYNVSPK